MDDLLRVDKQKSTGVQLLRDPHSNKGPAFSQQERNTLRLRGLIPPTPLSIEQ
jgi:malate dehydrogenase (oxaloacetate-decarboxylating)(NADP+)